MMASQDFLSACGRRISRLDVECGAEAVISAADLVALATTCTQLEAVAFTNFRVVAEVCVRTNIYRAPHQYPTHVTWTLCRWTPGCRTAPCR